LPRLVCILSRWSAENGCGRGGTTHDPKVAEKLIPTTYAARTGAGTVSATA